MKQSEILHEFLVLNTWVSGVKSKALKDRYLDRRCLVREYGNKVTLYFLDSGQTLIIPRDYIQIMRSLDVGSGEKLHYNDVTDPNRLNLFISGLARQSNSSTQLLAFQRIFGTSSLVLLDSEHKNFGTSWRIMKFGLHRGPMKNPAKH